MADHLVCPTRAEIKSNPGRYYVYILSRQNGEPFYVGCGLASGVKKNERIFDHEKSARRGDVSLKCSIIRKLWAEGHDVIRAIDSWHDSASSMFEREVSLIASIGRRDLGRGPLANGNDGGTGQMNPSAEIRAASSRSHKARWTEELREAQRQRVFAQHAKDPSLRKKIGEGQRDRWTDAEREKQAIRAKSGFRRPDVVAAMIAAQKAKFADPEHRERHRQRAIQLGADPDRKARWAQAQRDNWADPDYRARVLASRARKKATSS